MSCFRTAFAAAAFALGVVTPTSAAAPLRLEDAFQRVIESHPDLAIWQRRRDVLAAEREIAAQPPPVVAQIALENAPGTGGGSGFRQAEWTLSLASVLERGDKRRARIVVAERQFDATAVLEEARRVDLLAEVARRYLDVAVAGAEARLAAADVAQRERALVAATRRVDAGAAPISVRLAAMAAKQRAEGDVERAAHAGIAARRRLALLWGASSDPDFDVVASDFRDLPSVVAYHELQQRLAQNPELKVFAHESRIREARLRMAQSARQRELSWQVGLRRIETTDDWALMGSVSVPLGTMRRAEPAIRAAETELDALSLERDAARLGLEAALAEAHARIGAAVAEAERQDRALLPTLREAEAAAAEAYRRGALTYLEWAQVQSDTIAAQRQRLAASVDAHRALIEMQRLTGEPLLRAGTPPEEDRP